MAMGTKCLCRGAKNTKGRKAAFCAEEWRLTPPMVRGEKKRIYLPSTAREMTTLWISDVPS